MEHTWAMWQKGPVARPRKKAGSNVHISESAGSKVEVAEKAGGN